MKHITDSLFLGFLFSLFYLSLVIAEDVTVFDHSTGQYKYYDVEQSGNNLDVYDRETGHYKNFDVGSSGNIYDWKQNELCF